MRQRVTVLSICRSVVDLSICQSVDQHVNLSISQSVDQSVNLSIDLSTSDLSDRLVFKP